jgi:ribosomal protein S6E (S10)
MKGEKLRNFNPAWKQNDEKSIYFRPKGKQRKKIKRGGSWIGEDLVTVTIKLTH